MNFVDPNVASALAAGFSSATAPPTPPKFTKSNSGNAKSDFTRNAGKRDRDEDGEGEKRPTKKRRDEAPTIQQEVPLKDSCFRCGRSGHVSAECYAKSHVEGGPPRDPPPMRTSSAPAPSSRSGSNDPACRRCGRTGHPADKCYAKKHADGHEIGEARPEPTPPPPEPRDEEPTCFRCGRKGHMAFKCYAKKHASGRDIKD